MGRMRACQPDTPLNMSSVPGRGHVTTKVQLAFNVGSVKLITRGSKQWTTRLVDEKAAGCMPVLTHCTGIRWGRAQPI